MAYELKGIGYMRRKLAAKRTRVLTRYEYYEMKHLAADFDISTPPSLKTWRSVLGWCGRAVDSLADRLQFCEFRGHLRHEQPGHTVRQRCPVGVDLLLLLYLHFAR